MFRPLALLILLLGVVGSARAVTVRGHVTTALGQPLSGARVQLIQLTGGPRNAADAITDIDGSYELLSDAAGRFLLITSPPLYSFQYAPQIGSQFYGGRNDVLVIEVALNAGDITPQTSSQAGLQAVPVKQLAAAPQQVAGDALLTQAGLVPELRPLLGAAVVQLGQFGTPARLYVRGAPIAKTTVDGMSVEALGGGYNVSTLGTAGLAAILSAAALEVSGVTNPAYGLDSGAGVLSVTSARAATMHPVLTYVGDAGNLSTTRNAGIFSVVHSRSDALLEFARLNTDNDLPSARIHQVTEEANLGYQVSGNTSLRLTLRDDVDAAPLASPYGFYGVAPKTKLANQNLLAGFTWETRAPGDWHTLFRYGLARERAQGYNYATPATGLPVTITGANGASASGIASFLPVAAREDVVTNRDEYGLQSDHRFKTWLNVVGTVRYQYERGADRTSALNYYVSRKHYTFATVLSGEIKQRFFYDASGYLDHAGDIGWHGSPRVGMNYVPVRPGMRKFRGTSLHLVGGTGVRELSVPEAALVGSKMLPKSRTFSFGVEQNILAKKLEFRANYFHGQYSHESETVGLGPLKLSNGMAYRAQGLETEMRYNPAARWLIVGGYTYLASVVERSAATAVFNPNLPGVGIGATTALVGARPFDRAPNVGFVTAEYSGTKLSLSLKASFSGRSDGSTGLVLNPPLLLPNRDLSPRYASVDASFSYDLTHVFTVYSQLTNLLNDRYIAPIGYLSTPFGARVGVRIRVGRE